MNTAQGSAGRGVARFGYTVAIVSVGTLITGILVMLSLSVSACFLSRVIRCFSFPRDFTGFLLKMIQLWSLPALIVGILIATVGWSRGSVVWWNVLLVAALVSFAEAVSSGQVGSLEDIPLFLALGLVLFVGVQLSRLVSRWVGKFPI